MNVKKFKPKVNCFTCNFKRVVCFQKLQITNEEN